MARKADHIESARRQLGPQPRRPKIPEGFTPAQYAQAKDALERNGYPAGRISAAEINEIITAGTINGVALP